MPLTAIYGRVSSERQEHEETIKSQMAELRDTVRRSGRPDVIELTDEGYSRNDLARPGLDRLRDLVRSGEVDHVYVQRPDRLASGVKLVVLYEEIIASGAEISFIKGDIADTPEGKFLLHVQGAIGELERATISERTRRGKLYWAKQGFLPVRVQPYGYTYVPRSESGRATLGIDTETAPVVRTMFRWFTEDGLTLRGIASRLQKDGIPTPGKSKHWYASVVRKILSNRAYRGEVQFQTTERVRGSSGKKTRTRKRNESDWIAIPVPRIVSTETWQTAQVRLKQNREFASRNSKRRYMLRGLLFCSECGSRLVGQARRKRRVYRCNNVDKVVGSRDCNGVSVDADRIEQPVWESLSNALMNPRILLEQHNKRLEKFEAEDDLSLEKKQLGLVLSRITAQEDRITTAYRIEAMGLDRYKSEMVSLRARREGLSSQLQDLEKRQASSQTQRSIVQQIEDFCNTARVGLGALSDDGRQDLLRLLVERITVNDGQVKVETIIPTDTGESGTLCTRDPELDSESLVTVKDRSDPSASVGMIETEPIKFSR